MPWAPHPGCWRSPTCRWSRVADGGEPINAPPDSGIRIAAASLQTYVAAIGMGAGLPAERSDLLAGLLTTNDLRGIWRHGTRKIAAYARLMKTGTLNPRPDVRVIKESPVSVVMDGDGGLGYFPAMEATTRAVTKALQSGIAIGASRNHGHFGAAGIYARIPLEHGLITYVTSGHQLSLEPGGVVFSAGGGSPMAFSAPCSSEDPLVLDFGALHDLYSDNSHRATIMASAPGLVLRSIGLGIVCQSSGGLLNGVPLDPDDARRDWKGANQGALIITFRADLVGDAEAFGREMDSYCQAVGRLTPYPGFAKAYLPGGIEAQREREQRAEGILISQEHRAELDAVAGEVGVTPPW